VVSEQCVWSGEREDIHRKVITVRHHSSEAGGVWFGFGFRRTLWRSHFLDS